MSTEPFVELTKAVFQPHSAIGSPAYRPGDPVYLEPSAVLGIVPRGDFCILLLRGEREFLTVEVMESSQQVKDILGR